MPNTKQFQPQRVLKIGDAIVAGGIKYRVQLIGPGDRVLARQHFQPHGLLQTRQAHLEYDTRVGVWRVNDDEEPLDEAA